RTQLLSQRSLFFATLPPPPRSTLFPYTTLFRSRHAVVHALAGQVERLAGIASGEVAHGQTRRPQTGQRGVSHARALALPRGRVRDRKSTRLNSSHQIISYAVFCLKKKKKHHAHI